MLRRTLHGSLVPARLRPGSRNLQAAIERGMVMLDRGEEAAEVVLDRGDSLARHGTELQGQLALAARSPGVIPEIIVLLVDHIESVCGKPGKLRMGAES